MNKITIFCAILTILAMNTYSGMENITGNLYYVENFNLYEGSESATGTLYKVYLIPFNECDNSGSPSGYIHIRNNFEWSASQVNPILSILINSKNQRTPVYIKTDSGANLEYITAQ